MKSKIGYLLLCLSTWLPTDVLAITCPPAVICKTNSITSCYPVNTCLPLCTNYRRTHCWNAIKLQFGKLSRSNTYDRPPLNDMCYYLNDCGFYSIILDYQGSKSFKWAI